MTVQWGVLSTARINDKFLAGAAQSTELEILAVASRDGRRAREYADQHRIERAYGSYDELLGDPDIEAVYVSLPNSLHLEWSRRALAAGKHVLCEKPLGRRAADVEAIFDLAEREERLLTEAFMYRHNPQTARLVELVNSGAIGPLVMIRASFGFALTDAGNVRLSTELQGGALMDVGCYCVNAARLLAGEPEVVSGHQVSGGDGVDALFLGSMRFAGDVLAQFDAGFKVAARDQLEVIGEQATLFLDDPWHCLDPVIELRDGQSMKPIAVTPVNSYRLEAENLSAAIRGRSEPLLGRSDAVGQARTIEALYQAADSGRAVQLPYG